LCLANLHQANLDNAILIGAYLAHADLQEATLRGANLQEADLQGAILTGARYDHWTQMPRGFVGYRMMLYEG